MKQQNRKLRNGVAMPIAISFTPSLATSCKKDSMVTSATNGATIGSNSIVIADTISRSGITIHCENGTIRSSGLTYYAS